MLNKNIFNIYLL